MLLSVSLRGMLHYEPAEGAGTKSEFACTGFTGFAVATNKDFYLEYEMANEHVNMTILNITSWLP